MLSANNELNDLLHFILINYTERVSALHVASSYHTGQHRFSYIHRVAPGWKNQRFGAELDQ